MLSEGLPPLQHTAHAGAQPELQAFLGKFERAEPQQTVRARIDAAIEQSIAPLSWPVRVVARPALRFTAQLPDWVAIEHKDGLLGVTFSSGIALRAELGGPSRLHHLPAATKADVRHVWRAGQICSEIVSEAGTITNVFELSGADEIIGHAQLESQHLPAPICYTMRLARCAARP
jgi:hypothetical protein